MLSRALLLSAALGCGAVTKDKPAAKPEPFRVAIRVEHVEGADAWRVTYRLSEPVRALVFGRAPYPFRKSNWSVRAPVVLVRDADGDRLTAPEPVDGFVIDIPTYHKLPEKDYVFLIGFSDGSSLLYTGQLDVAPVGDRPVETTFTFVPRASERVIVLGTVGTGPTEWRGSSDGTYVYFGSTTPEVTPELTAVVDGGTPAWLRDRTRDLLPKLFALYTRRTGHRLDFKPVVYLNYGEAEGDQSRSYGGNSLPGVVQLEVRLGSALMGTVDATTTERVAHMLAHEAAHLWNGQMFTNDGGDWLHEGGAEAFAFRAMRELGAIDAGEYRAALSNALSTCLLGLGGRPLRESSKPGLTRNYYHCGLTIALLTEASLKARSPEVDLFGFWGRLFAGAPGRHYDETGYRRLLADLAGADAAELVRRIVEEPIADGREIARALQSRGVQIREDEAAVSEEYRERAKLLACLAVVSQDCDGAAAQVDGSRCSVGDAGSCRSFKAGAAPKAVDEIALGKDGIRAYDHIVATCARGGRMSVALGANTVSVPCRKPVPPRVPYLVVGTTF